MLLDGVNHVAVITDDAPRLHAFYAEVFDAEVDGEIDLGSDGSLSFVRIGPHTELNVFQRTDGGSLPRHAMFARGPLDHLGLQAASLEAFEEIRRRLMDRGAADDFVTDFGAVFSVFFRDPDGLECEVCVANPDAVPGVTNPPGTRAVRYS